MTSARILMFAFVGLLWTAVAAVGAPTVALAPKIGPPTALVTVNGAGFGAYAAVDVFFDTSAMCLTFADGAGAATCTIKVPKDAQPQTHWVSMLQRGTATGAQKPFLVRSDWTQFHGRNAAHTGFNQFENTLNTNNAPSLDVLWAAPFAAGDHSNSTPVVAGNIAYVKAETSLYAFNATTGAPIAGFPRSVGGFDSFSTPAVGNGNVYVSSTTGQLFAFKALTGADVPGFPVGAGGSNTLSSPVLAYGKVYVGGSGKIHAFDALTGAAVAGFPVTAPIDSTVSAAYGRIYAYGTDGNYYAFDAATGAAVSGFPFALPPGGASTTAVASGHLFFGSYDFKLHARSAANGAAVTGFPVTTGDIIVTSPAVANGHLVIGSLDDKLYDVNPVSGALRWSTTLDGDVRGSPIIANGLVFTRTPTSLYAVSLSSGSVLWRALVVSAVLSSPTVVNGVVYMASIDGNLYAYSVNGEPVSARLPGGELGVKPSLSALKPDYSLKAVDTPHWLE